MSLKKTISVICITMISSVLMAQTGIGTTAPDTSSVLDITSTNKGFLPPRVASVNDISNPVKGLVVYDELNNCIRFYNGTEWSVCIDGAFATNTGCYAMVDATTYKDFLCHNLGADYALDPHTPDVGLQGGYVQWGKRGPNTTGDSRDDWQTAVNTSIFAAAPTSFDPNENTISGWSQNAAANGSWNSGTEAVPVKTTNDPCPDGFRVPTRAEWVAVDTYNTRNTDSYTWTSSSVNYGVALHYGPDTSTKWLTLPAAGYRFFTTGLLSTRGSGGIYWSSTEKEDRAYNLRFISNSMNPANGDNRALGFSIRCIAE